MAMSQMTNGVFAQAELWSAFNKLSAYNFRQDSSLMNIEKSHKGVKASWKIFESLKETDIDKKLKEFKMNNNNGYADERVMFQAVQQNINETLKKHVKDLEKLESKHIILGEKDSKSNGKNRQDIQYYFSKCLLDNAKLRMLCSKYQVVLYNNNFKIDEFGGNDQSEIPHEFG